MGYGKGYPHGVLTRSRNHHDAQYVRDVVAAARDERERKAALEQAEYAEKFAQLRERMYKHIDRETYNAMIDATPDGWTHAELFTYMVRKADELDGESAYRKGQREDSQADAEMYSGLRMGL